MKRTLVITGAASGIGKATAERCKAKGHTVIGVDIHDADIVADLSTPAGRKAMIDKVAKLAPDGIDGVLTSAGSANFDKPGMVLATNYFGTVDVIAGLRPQMRAPGARCVAVASTALLAASDETLDLEELCLAGDEEAAVARAEKGGFLQAYPGAKRALSKWARQTTIKPEWAAQGVTINTVAPGVVKTPMVEGALADPRQAATIREKSPKATAEYAEASDAAELMEFLLNCETDQIVGQVIFLDSGSEAIQRPNL